ncbi:arogenate dehydrogenase 2, chloroplastic isoform X2 [Prunus dulcis]|uniref:arogenate dehydrogenase 2, chloroplastic isoform X2 n=1 Tax=Prunus dulcis TaxID=3755 RepID=UPI00148249D8|nr:arogenate dehydrogenase 2, chloroplastic isoform X2 [Prunus dulcis]
MVNTTVKLRTLSAQRLRQSFEFYSRLKMFSLCPLHPSPPKPSLPPSLSLNPQSFNLFSNPSLIRTRSLRPKSLKIQYLDAAQPYDYESKVAAQFHEAHMLKIAIIGFGNYGQFLAKTLVTQGHTVLAHSRSDYSKTAQDLGVSFFSDPHDLCEQHPQVILLCTSILSTEPVLKSLPLQRLRRNTLVVDVLSVKELERLDLAFEALKKQLFGHLHDVVRKQLFGNAEKARTLQEDYAKQAQNGAALVSSSKALRSPKIVRSDVQKAQISDDNSRLKIAIVGFGNFGQFLAKTIIRQGHTVLAFSRTDYSDVAQKLGVSYFSDADDLCEEHPEVILLCTSILSTEKVLRSLPLQRLKRNTLFVDVLSVKEFPRNMFLQTLPLDFDILCTHPMFGPESGKNGWNGLSFVYDKVRVGSDESRVSRCDQFLDIFAREGCRMVEMSCAEHDRHAAGSQFITHTMGRILEKLGLESTPINTKGYETLLNLVENTAGDSFDLYYGLFMYNINAMEQLKRLDMAFESLKKQLFGRLHGVLRKQLFENADKSQVMQEQALLPKPSQNESALTPSRESLNIQKN